ncbi:metallophosphoesterase [Pseudopedobacter saltans DSM 12145]|uniref:Metallophosphoesterase n=1 Tax=Pseudopedobacter saltans (strain ATCC 51119 / DSM 12145 / JCM 21818 / CCUG 39354 / LMG 10337 / NBRC 100064 / NCIMB 13643) TaxID=762903 RepID=F0S9R2_PSESL|nr:BamA/TamA family outer membrane protein [Pseudopedobacter saltans]ADY51418.1 metallophosphoesterase [Pseudopedobacter saltans DSM 12145]
MIKKFFPILFVLTCFKFLVFAQKRFYNVDEKDWRSNKIQDSTSLIRSIFLISDVGYLKKREKGIVLDIMQKQLNRSSKNDLLIFLGDNTNSLKRDTLPNGALLKQLNLGKNFKGKTLFIAGNRDWHNKVIPIKEQQHFIDRTLGSPAFVPENIESIVQKIDLKSDLIVIAVQTELLLNKDTEEEKKKSSYATIEKIILDNTDKNILIVQHHPIYSNGVHGGFFSLKDHLFPLTSIHKNLYIPLPIIGSLYPIIRQYGISKQDLNNIQYQELIQSLSKIIANKKNVVIASGHEHSLQLLKQGNINQLVSGSGSLSTRVFNIYPALFGMGALGYAKLDYYENGQCWVEFYSINSLNKDSQLIFKKALYGLKGDHLDLVDEKSIDYKDSIKAISAGTEYASSKKRQKTFGKQYRQSWITPVHVSYLDLTREKGGLEVKSSSDNILILQDKEKTTYTFRLINRNPHDLLPKGFDATIIEDIVKDQTSTSQPYGALVVDYLSKKANLPSFETQLFFLPYTRLLKENLADFGGHLGLLEKSLSNYNNLISTDSLYTVLENHHVKVNQYLYLKNRLFDLLIGDYHRDESTWLWQSKKHDGNIIYSPFNKNRIQFFTKIDGYVPSFLRKLVPEVQTFGYTIKKPEKLAISARNLDRNLLNELSETDWIAVAEELMEEITDKVIEESVRKLPPESFEIDGQELIKKLIARKNNLKETALNYYNVLAKDIRIVGTNKPDIANIKRNRDSTTVTMNNFKRQFSNKKTKQIQVFALDGNDTLKVSGTSKAPIKVRFVGGNGVDYVKNSSKSKHLFIYDNPDSNIEYAKPAKLILTDERWINEFSRDDFIYNKSGFSPDAMIYNATDFVSIGLSHQIKNRGFRKEPFAFEQKVGALMAPKTGALEIKYLSTFYSIFSNNLDLVLSGRYIGPAYDFNFYGTGNSSENTDKLKYYQVRSKNAHFNVFAQKRISNRITAGIGPGFSYFNILKQSDNSFIRDNGIETSTTNWFLNMSSYVNFDLSDDTFYPKNGWRWASNANYFSQINNEKYNFVKLQTDFRYYYTPSRNVPFTMALRLGANTNIGNYNFYHSNTLGNLTNLRGYRADRFSGKSSLYGNFEGRLKLTKIRSYVLAGDIGAFGFYDTGRVFSNVTELNKWHSGYGPGIWINFFDHLLVSLGYGISSEDKVFSLNIGCRF